MSNILKQIVVIGGGFAGLRALYRLREYDFKFEVTLIDKSKYSIEKPTLPEVAIEGKKEDSVELLLPSIARESKAAFILGEVDYIDTKNQFVILKDEQKVYYDYLIIASGAIKDYNSIQGYREFGYSVCDNKEAKKLYNRLNTFESGDIVLGSAKSKFSKNSVAPVLSAPCEGPIGEVAFMLNHKFKDKINLNIFSPSKVFFEDVGKNTREKVGKIMQERGFKIHTDKIIKKIDKYSVTFEDNSSLPSNLTIIIPPYKAPSFIQKSNLDDDEGWMSVKLNMQHIQFDNIYGCGDITNLSQPKLGHIAINQADVAVSNILNKEGLIDKSEIVEFNPEVFCIMNMGGLDAILIYSDALYNKHHDLAWHSKLAKVMKTSFDAQYHYTHGHMPPDSITELLEDALKKLSD